MYCIILKSMEWRNNVPSWDKSTVVLIFKKIGHKIYAKYWGKNPIQVALKLLVSILLRRLHPPNNGQIHDEKVRFCGTRSCVSAI